MRIENPVVHPVEGLFTAAASTATGVLRLHAVRMPLGAQWCRYRGIRLAADRLRAAKKEATRKHLRFRRPECIAG